jgi:hypothetical protein
MAIFCKKFTDRDVALARGHGLGRSTATRPVGCLAIAAGRVAVGAHRGAAGRVNAFRRLHFRVRTRSQS